MITNKLLLKKETIDFNSSDEGENEDKVVMPDNPKISKISASSTSLLNKITNITKSTYYLI